MGVDWPSLYAIVLERLHWAAYERRWVYVYIYESRNAKGPCFKGEVNVHVYLTLPYATKLSSAKALVHIRVDDRPRSLFWMLESRWMSLCLPTCVPADLAKRTSAINSI